jgi:hypothetical protein
MAVQAPSRGLRTWARTSCTLPTPNGHRAHVPLDTASREHGCAMFSIIAVVEPSRMVDSVGRLSPFLCCARFGHPDTRQPRGHDLSGRPENTWAQRHHSATLDSEARGTPHGPADIRHVVCRHTCRGSATHAPRTPTGPGALSPPPGEHPITGPHRYPSDDPGRHEHHHDGASPPPCRRSARDTCDGQKNPRRSRLLALDR